MAFIRLWNLNIETLEYKTLKKTGMKFMRRKAGYNSLDHRRNEDIIEELNVDLIEMKLIKYKET